MQASNRNEEEWKPPQRQYITQAKNNHGIA